VRAWRADELVRLAARRRNYRREQALPRLLPLIRRGERESEFAFTHTIVANLERAVRAERQRGRAGHWTYDLNRHAALNQALMAEKQHLMQLMHAAHGRAPAGRPRGGTI
jgi:hypothetical protein